MTEKQKFTIEIQPQYDQALIDFITCQGWTDSIADFHVFLLVCGTRQNCVLGGFQSFTNFYVEHDYLGVVVLILWEKQYL